MWASLTADLLDAVAVVVAVAVAAAAAAAAGQLHYFAGYLVQSSGWLYSHYFVLALPAKSNQKE